MICIPHVEIVGFIAILGTILADDLKPLRIGFHNSSRSKISVNQAIVIKGDVSSGVCPPGDLSIGNTGMNGGRGSYTPDDFLATTVRIQWWNVPKGQYHRIKPKRSKDIFRQAIDVPRLDAALDMWDCHFFLQRNNVWTGRFHGALLKPPGEPDFPEREQTPARIAGVAEATEYLTGDFTSRTPLPYTGNDRWIQYQLKNLTDKDLAIGKGFVVNDSVKAALMMHDFPADGKFHGCAAHNFPGSIYRPEEGAELQLEWGRSRWSRSHQQTIPFPKFDPEVKNWYCYYTLHPDHTWTAEFEGVLENAGTKTVEGSP